jgi:hypothetical protein
MNATLMRLREVPMARCHAAFGRNERAWRSYLFALLVSLLLTGVPCALATDYSALSFNATVIDKETRKPIEGAVALAIWDLSYYTGHSSGIFNATEAVTDVNGKFHMAGWGPLPVPRGEGGAPRVLDPGQPSIFVFKPGYRIHVRGGDENMSFAGNPFWTGDLVRKVWADGATFELLPIQESEEYMRLFDLDAAMPLWVNCLWVRNPRMTAALVNESNRLHLAFPKYANRLHWTNFENTPADKCGNPKEILGPYLK